MGLRGAGHVAKWDFEAQALRMQRVAIRPTHSAPQPISTCSEASLIILYPPLAFAARAAAPSVAHLIITAAVERGAPTCPVHSGCQLLDSVVADALSHPFSIRLFAALVAAAAAAPAERLACAHVLLADTSSCTDRGGSAADGCDSGSSPGRADSPAGVQALLDDRRQHAGALFQRLPPLAMRLATAAAFFIGCSPDVS